MTGTRVTTGSVEEVNRILSELYADLMALKGTIETQNKTIAEMKQQLGAMRAEE